MSGRLIILPKKSYTPWNTANVERVLRDERIAKEKEEKLKDNTSANPLLARREAAKNDTHSQQHFNLFEKEEKEAADKVVVTKQQTNSSIGIMPVMLGGNEAINKKKGKVPFYLQVPEENQNLTYEDEKLKLNMDPMKAFTTNPPLQQQQQKQPNHKDKVESSQECQMMIIQKANKNDKHHSNDDDDLSSDDNVKKKNKKKKRKHKDYKKRKRSKRSKHKSRRKKDVIDSMEELRERRAEREKNEQERQNHVVYQQSIKPQNGSLNHRTYQDQYNPQFSRN